VLFGAPLRMVISSAYSPDVRACTGSGACLAQDQPYLKNTLAVMASGALAPLVAPENLQVLQALANAAA